MARWLHAKVAIEGHECAGIERSCRYNARPAIAREQLSPDPDGRGVYHLRRAWRDGTSAIVFEPLAFLERLAALEPRPRARLLTNHGVLARAAQRREPIVPRAQAESHGRDGRPVCSHIGPTAPAERARPRARRSTWAEFLRRAFVLDVLIGPHCGGARSLIATITDLLVVKWILDPLEIPSSPPPTSIRGTVGNRSSRRLAAGSAPSRAEPRAPSWASSNLDVLRPQLSAGQVVSMQWFGREPGLGQPNAPSLSNPLSSTLMPCCQGKRIVPAVGAARPT